MKKLLSWQMVLVLFLGLFFLRNSLLPMVSDDIPYAFIWDGDDRGNLLDGVGQRQRIASFYDIVISQWSHYFTWGGRTPPHFLAQCLLWGGKVVSSLATALCYISLIYIIYLMGTGKKISPFKMPFVPVVLRKIFVALSSSSKSSISMHLLRNV